MFASRRPVFSGVLRAAGPGIVVTGFGHRCRGTDHAAAGIHYGYAILWAVNLSCIIKYWLQMELGRFCLATSLTTIQALQHSPRGNSQLNSSGRIGSYVSTRH
jgi:Mn2+/Fe2+ NRAMP family transporter